MRIKNRLEYTESRIVLLISAKAIINNNYQLSAIMVNAIKELSAKNDALEAKVTTLETVQAEHETSILALEAA